MIRPRALIVGLGNPGPQYVDTRHNVGFRVLDQLASGFVPMKEVRGAIVEMEIEGVLCILLKPLTYMNLSGQSIEAALKRWKIPKSALLVIADDIYLPLGKTRVRAKGSPAGHNGLIDIERRLGSREFWRVKVGVDAPAEGEELSDYVLAPFSKKEQELLQPALDAACSQVKQWLSALKLQPLTERTNQENM